MEVSAKYRSKAKAIVERVGFLDKEEFWQSIKDEIIVEDVWIAKPEEKIMPFRILVLMDQIVSKAPVPFPLLESIEQDLEEVVYRFPVDDTDRLFYRICTIGGRVDVWRMIGVNTHSEADEMMKNLKTNVKVST